MESFRIPFLVLAARRAFFEDDFFTTEYRCKELSSTEMSTWAPSLTPLKAAYCASSDYLKSQFIESLNSSMFKKAHFYAKALKLKSRMQ